MAYIWIRSTGNWHDERAFLAQMDPAFEPYLAAWNETFEMPFHDFRARVHDVARANLETVRGARVADWDDIPDGALVMPTDDDDWFAPHAAETLERIRRPGAPAYAWEASFAETPMWLGHRIYLTRRVLLPWMPPRFSCSTNSYAFEKRPDSRPLLADHTLASEWVDDAPGDQVVRLPDRLSMVNRTLASRTQLRSGERNRPPTRAELLRKRRRYERRYRRMNLSRTPWAKPWVAMMGDLMSKLEARG